MSLNWNIEKVKNWEDLDKEQHAVLDAIIWLTMAIGINELTTKNVKEFHARLRLIEKLYGAFIHKDGEEKFITLEELERLVGLWTNVTTYTRNQFNKNQLERFYREEGL